MATIRASLIPSRQQGLVLLLLAFLIFSITTSASSSDPARKLDETSNPDDQSKCGGCHCSDPCPKSPPPPSPPPPCPPPPPPPHKKPPSTAYCPPPPPPPPSNYVYINGPPGDLYPIDGTYSASDRNFGAAYLVGWLCSLLLMFWQICHI